MPYILLLSRSQSVVLRIKATGGKEREMKQGKHEKPKPKIDIHNIDWESILMFVVAVVLGIVLVIMFATHTFKATGGSSSVEQVIETHLDETNWIPPEPEVTEEPEIVIPRIHIGRCRLTIYTPYETHHGYNTATGVKAQHLMTCAVDPKLIPYRSNVILIKPDGTEHRLKAIDCGNFKGHMIDVFFDGTVTGGVGWLVEVFGEEYADVWIETPGAQDKAL